MADPASVAKVVYTVLRQLTDEEGRKRLLVLLLMPIVLVMLMLAVYAPIRPGTEGQVLPWVYGEALEVGAKRTDPTDGKTYEAIQKPGVNIYEPHIVPAIWKVVS